MVTPNELQEWCLAAVTVAGAVVTTVIVPVAIKLAPVLIETIGPLLRNRLADERDRAVFDAVTRAGKRAASAAIEAYERDGQGLSAEQRASNAVAAGLADLRRQGVFDAVIAARGGQAAVEADLQSIVLRALQKQGK